MLLSTSACSFGLVKAPKEPHAVTAPGECTASYTAPVLDTIGAVPNVVAGVALLAGSMSTQCSTPDYDDNPFSGVGYGVCTGVREAMMITAVPMLIVGSLHSISAAYGYKAVGECRVLDASRSTKYASGAIDPSSGVAIK